MNDWPVFQVWVPAALLLLLAGFHRTLDRTVLAPATFFTLVWVLYFATGAVGLAVQGQPPGAVCWVVLGLVLAFGAGARLRDVFAGDAWSGLALERAELRTVRLGWTTVLFALIGSYSVPGTLLFAGFGPGDLRQLTSLSGLQAIAGVMSDLRYGDFADEPLAVRAALGFLYLSALFGGMLMGSGPEAGQGAASSLWRRRAVALIPVAVSVAYVLVTTSKTPLMMCLFMFFGAWMAQVVRLTPADTQPRPPRALIVAVPVSVLLSLPYIYFLIVVRAGEAGTSRATDEGLRTYFLSHLASFAAWLEKDRLLPETLGWGQFSFSGAFGRLGLAQRAQGVYGAVTLPDTGDESNLFTVFRGLLQDFGAAGTVLLLVACGAVAQHLYLRTRAGNTHAAVLLSLVYLTALLSFLYSPFIFNNVIATCILFVGFARLMVRPAPGALGVPA